MSKPAFVIRMATEADAEGILLVHRDAVHHIANKDYDAEILEQWSPPVNEERISHCFTSRFRPETTVIAVLDNKIVGFGAIGNHNELHAVYVTSGAAGLGVGTAILQQLEAIAKDKGFVELKMDSSVTAGKFYVKHGYEILGYGAHKLRSGREMACVHMRKSLV